MKKIITLMLFIFLFFVGTQVYGKGAAKSNSWSCFPAGTKITMATPHTSSAGGQAYVTKNIEDVKVGDMVISQSVAGTKSVSTVTSLETPIRDNMCQITFKDGDSLKLTNEHPLLTTTGWKAIKPQKEAYKDSNLVVGTLARGDSVIKLDTAPGIVRSISCWPEKVQTYNLILSGGVHTYFADGFLAHNKFSPTANFNKAERAAQNNGTYGNATTFATNYVTDLYLSGKLIDQTSSQLIQNAVASAKAQVQDAVAAYNRANPYSPQLDPIVVLSNLQAGMGLSAGEVTALYQYTGFNSTIGKQYGCGSSGQGVCYAGFYNSLVCDNNVCNFKYFPIGTGPNAATAKEGDVIAPPPPPGTIQARAVTMATIPETCDQIKEATPSTTFRDGTQFDLKLGTVSQGVKTQSGSSYVSWSLQPNTYTLSALSPGTSSVRYCLTDGTGSHFGVRTDNLASNVTDTFDVAYGPPPAWFQAQGGDVYAATNISALTSSGASPRLFLLDGSGGFPGVVTYGGASADYDFSPDGESKGETYVSTKNWLANDAYADLDFYSYFYSKLGSPTTPDYANLTDPLPQPASDSGRPIYVKGDMTTSGNWTVVDGQKYIFLVDGALTIGGKINITGNGFIAFIAKGDISVASSVGGAYNAVAPDVEGVYVSSGAIHTGFSSVAGAERFVGKGMFVANNVALERDLQSVNQNAAYAAELFIYNPALLVKMPDMMKNVPVSWQEVAP